jgi:polyhydroxybutyrate depolymerase
MVDGVAREALVYTPASAKALAAPLVFAFHGHGGTMQHAARTFAYHTHWPEAIVVYMQGLKTPSLLVDPAGKQPGWQRTVGDQSDRDLKFFDVVFASLRKEYKVDGRRVYCTGHSNGGAFTYLLWAARGDEFAAFAPSAAPAGRSLRDLKPKPVLHIAGENDNLVKFAWQKQTMDEIRKRNGCATEGKAWAKYCTWYESKDHAPVVTYVHPGTHKFPSEAPPVVVKFFKEIAK